MSGERDAGKHAGELSIASRKRRWLRRIGLGFAALIVLLLVAYGTLYALANRQLNRVYAAPTEPVQILEDSAAIATGERLVRSRGCTACHGEQLAGDVLTDKWYVGQLVSANLTRGRGGRAAQFSGADWARAVRHGLKRDGRPLVIMPSQAYHDMTDEDVGAIAAYARSVPPVDDTLPPLRIGPLARVFVWRDKEALPARLIDHAKRVRAPSPAISAAYGEYMARLCAFCHGEDLAGRIGDGERRRPPPNLTRGGALGAWTENDFIVALRTGRTPAGVQLDSARMPWNLFRFMTETELKALWLYLQSLPARSPGTS